jgi:hypothetical protein
LIVAGPTILADLGLNAAIQHNVLVIVGRGGQVEISSRRFQPLAFPGLRGLEARLVKLGEGEIIVNKTVLIPISVVF